MVFMVKRVPSPDKIVIDPLFPLPEGAEDEFVLSRENTDTQLYFEDEVDDTFYDDGSDDIEELVAPNDLEVIKQTVTSVKGGNEVVDVVFRFTTVEGAKSYELQVTKV
jgi:hypothetical protein